MGISATDGQKQQLPTKHSTEIKPTNTKQNQPRSNRRNRKEKNLDKLQLL